MGDSVRVPRALGPVEEFSVAGNQEKRRRKVTAL